MHTTNQFRSDHDSPAKPNQRPLAGVQDLHYSVDPLWSGELNDFQARTLAGRRKLLFHDVLTRMVELQLMVTRLRHISTQSERTTVLHEAIDVARELTRDGWSRIDDVGEAKLNRWLESSECLIFGELDDRCPIVRMLPWDRD